MCNLEYAVFSGLPVLTDKCVFLLADHCPYLEEIYLSGCPLISHAALMYLLVRELEWLASDFECLCPLVGQEPWASGAANISLEGTSTSGRCQPLLKKIHHITISTKFAH